MLLSRSLLLLLWKLAYESLPLNMSWCLASLETLNYRMRHLFPMPLKKTEKSGTLGVDSNTARLRKTRLNFITRATAASLHKNKKDTWHDRELCSASDLGAAFNYQIIWRSSPPGPQLRSQLLLYLGCTYSKPNKPALCNQIFGSFIEE